ncbi:hypothetical protein [Blastococcus sp. CCUG 61487]|uniref:hypothetical protein n=1 Tax=Blastococcus sp. CCUG 61487 TaxID=1840703 RepID=UPI0010C0BB5E|nr:hypothetical protein [Blastococcus sp. CCUG 61487]TKJ19652.1 hypothetical protein A6V29_00785 [Blastococcus sp. CCUG 61487]
MGMNKRERATTPTLAFDGFGTGGALRVRRITTVATTAALSVGLMGPVAAVASTEAAADPVEVIVPEAAGAGDPPEQAVAALSGTVEEPLGIIDGFTATLPADRLPALRAARGVIAVTENAPVELLDAVPADVQDQVGSMFRVTHEVIGATALWERGIRSCAGRPVAPS